VLGDVLGLADLKLRVARQELEPPLRRVPEADQRLSGVGHQQPSAIVVAGEDVGHDTGPAIRERSGERNLERLMDRACLEPHRLAFGLGPVDDGPRFGLDVAEGSRAGDP
jgi:hypothetical protein